MNDTKQKLLGGLTQTALTHQASYKRESVTTWRNKQTNKHTRDISIMNN